MERDISGSGRPSFSGALAVGRKLDLPLPDSPTVRDAYAYAEAESQPWLFNHVMRAWLYSAKLAQSRGLAPDAELVAVAVSWRPLVRAMQAFAIETHICNMDEFRHAIERMTPRHYIRAPYFERHLTAIATLLIEKGIATLEEVESLVDGEFPLSSPLGPGRLPCAPQSFAIGETVRVKNEFVSGHVRVPAYIRGKTGTIVHVSTPTPFPDAAGHNMHAEMEPTYDVRFRASDLWPDTSDEALNHVGVFQSYLEKVESA